ncbi:MAG: GNAT family N-acetyltransferase [Acidobacteria bacterium]|nr:GNAT family N-acetyltransferase [Acidobacteriota bacterium]
MPTFSTADFQLARRLESAEAANAFSLAAGSAEAEAFFGGCALFGGVGSPLTHALGIGMEGPAGDAEFDRMEEFFRSRGSASLIDLCPLSHPTFLEQISRRGYKVIELNNLMLRQPEVLPEVPCDGRIARCDAARHEEWMHLMMRGFSEGHDPSPEMLTLAGTMPAVDYEFIVELNGRPAGGAALAILGDIAMLFGDSTLPEARGHGIQQALIQHRLAIAAREGCEWAMATVIPGSGSHRNYERQGFGFFYMRVNVMREW